MLSGGWEVGEGGKEWGRERERCVRLLAVAAARNGLREGGGGRMREGGERGG